MNKGYLINMGMETRNKTIDVMKGISICLMVVGHSGAPKSLTQFIYFICHYSLWLLVIFGRKAILRIYASLFLKKSGGCGCRMLEW